MSARQRALAFLAALALAATCLAWLVAARSDSGATAPTRRPAVRVAGTTGGTPTPFPGELLVWAFGGFSPREVGLAAGSSRVAAISAVRTGLLAVAGGVRGFRTVPVEAMAVDREAYGTALGRAGGRLQGLL